MEQSDGKIHSIGKTIAGLRKEKGWTQTELAEKLQVSDKAISKWEKDGGAPSVEFFPALAELFGVSIDYIMTGKKPEPEIITISKIELCAKNDDPELPDGIDCKTKDENDKTIVDYILQYGSLNVFVALCEQNRNNITCFKLLDALKLAILSNRLDLFRDVTFSENRARYTFKDERDILELLPESVANNIYFKGNKYDCILTDDIFETIACDDKTDKKTRGILLGKQKGRECVWYHVFPYLIHQSYLHNKTDMLEKLLSQTNRNNNYAYENMPMSGNNYVLNFYFIGERYYKNEGHGLVRILAETIDLALERGDFESFEKFDAINKAIVEHYNFKPHIATEYDIRMAKLRADKTVSKKELTIQSTIHDGVADIDELLATKDAKIIKKVLDNYPVHPVEKFYNWVKDKNWRKLFEFAVDNGLQFLADYVIKQNVDGIYSELVNIFKVNYYGNVFKSLSQSYPVFKTKPFAVRDKKLDHVGLKIEQIIEYLAEYKKQVISDFLCESEQEKVVVDLTKEKFQTELAKGNTEMVIVKLCVRLEAILRSTYRYEGDFSEMLNKYCDTYGREDDGYGYDREAAFVGYLHKLRKCRNSIVHSEKTQEKLTPDEIKYCIDYICNMK